MRKGVFWIVDGELLAFPFLNDEIGTAKSGTTYNHKKLWEYVRPKDCNKAYNYYPRGRVDVSNKGKPVIYMNPNIDDRYIPLIIQKFSLEEAPVIRYDGSAHYKCYWIYSRYGYFL